MDKVPNGVEILPKISTACRVHYCVTDRRQTDGRATAYSEREREFTFANKLVSVERRLSQRPIVNLVRPTITVSVHLRPTKLTTPVTIDVPRRNFLSCRGKYTPTLIFEIAYRYMNLLTTQCRVVEESLCTKTSSIRSAVFDRYRLVTDGPGPILRIFK